MELAALASMCVAQLPFPPMPLCVIRGEEHTDSFCSSHDLLASAIAVHHLKCDTRTIDLSEEAKHMATKQNILIDMQREVHDAVQHSMSVDGIYNIFQKHFRTYMTLYQNSQDMRFTPIEFVDSDGIVCQQAQQHLASVETMESSPVHVSSNRFSDIIMAYARLLHAYGTSEAS